MVLRDPLEALKATTKVEPQDESAKLYIKGDDGTTELVGVTDTILGPLVTDSLVHAYNNLLISTERAREELGLFRKVVTCHNCDEYAFDGTFTIFSTDDEGDQGFCHECVAKIEMRSKPREPSMPFYGGFQFTPTWATAKYNGINWSNMLSGSNTFKTTNITA